MPARLDYASLRPELRSPHLRPVMVSYLNLLAGQVGIAHRLRGDGVETLTLLDSVVNLAVFVLPNSSVVYATARLHDAY